jgi:hypothetical protein
MEFIFTFPKNNIDNKGKKDMSINKINSLYLNPIFFLNILINKKGIKNISDKLIENPGPDKP